MSRFQANFSIYPNTVYAPAKLSFDNKSTVGLCLNDSFTTAVDDNGDVVTISLPIQSITVNVVDKVEWTFDNGTISVDQQPQIVYDYPGQYNVSLSIFSNEYYDELFGIFYRIRNTITKTVDVGSMTVAWLRQHMTAPHLSAMDTSQGFRDLIEASSKSFDKMYVDISEAVKLIDIRTLAARFLQYMSDTLGHKRTYASKVGYKNQIQNTLKQNFIDYDIFERIEKETAGPDEIENFRKFIADTASIFKKNGSEEAMEDFFKLYGFIIDIEELWSVNFGQDTQASISDNFYNDPTLERTLNKFRYKTVTVSGLDNSKLYTDSDAANIVLDNYHFNSTHIYPNEADVDDPANCQATFKINDYSPYVLKVARNDGRELASKFSCANFEVGPECLGKTFSCLENGLKIEKDPTWEGVNRIVNGVATKFWRTQDNYVRTVNDVVGPLPTGQRESEEDPINTEDDYLWANWSTGITIPSAIVGFNQYSYRRPSLTTILPNINLATESSSSQLYPNDIIDTSRDLFVVDRGFIKIDTAGYYQFFVNVANPGTDSNDNHIALMSLKHNTTLDLDDINTIESLDDIVFNRFPGDIEYVVTDNNVPISIFGKAGEYGVLEIRQDEIEDNFFSDISQNSGFYRLAPGYYAFEIKATYNTYKQKRLRLSWEIWNEVSDEGVTTFRPVVHKSIVPNSNFVTIQSPDIGIEDKQGNGLLTVPYSLLEGSDIFKVLYARAFSEENNVSGFISSDKTFADLEIYTKILYSPSTDFENRLNGRATKDKFGIIFRGTNKNKDLYSSVDSYYAFIFDAKKSEYGIAYVQYNDEIDDVYYRYLNIDPTAKQNDLIFTKSILDENGYIKETLPNTYYDFRIVVVDDKVSVYYRENNAFTTIVNNIRQSVYQNIQSFVDVDDWVLLLDNISLDIEDVFTETFDITNKVIEIADVYRYQKDFGYYGISLFDSVIKVNSFTVFPLDKVDTTLVNTIDKYKTIKPKYLDYRNNDLLKYNSYDETDNPLKTFNYTLISGVQFRK
jgi:hypothetical protein